MTAGSTSTRPAAPGTAECWPDELADVLVGLGEADAEHDTDVVLFLDEMQELAQDDLSALHRAVQRALPITVVGTGLPRLRRAVGKAQSSLHYSLHYVRPFHKRTRRLPA